MAFNIPEDQQEVIDRTRTDVQNALPESNPFLKNSFLGSLVVSFAGRIFDFYLQLNVLIKELFVDTATNAFLERWGSYKDITRNPATKSTGSATATGTATSVIPISSALQDANGNQFVTIVSATIINTVISITNLTRSGTTVTATTTSNHELASNQSVTIAGAVETEYNGTQTVTVTAADVFTYEIATTPSTPATGTITADADLATIAVESVGFGNDQNLDSGTNLTFSSPIAGVDDIAIVQFGQVAGGTDIESDEDLRVRIIDQYQNPIAQFNKNAIISQAKKITGVTRVFLTEAGDAFGDQVSVTSITRSGSVATVTTATNHGLVDCMTATISGSVEPEYSGIFRILVISDTVFTYIIQATPTTPATGTIVLQSSVTPGQVVIFFTRDNDDSIIPSASEVTTTKDKILEIKPANTSDIDVIVKAPTANTVDFTFTSLTPNTSTMQASISANLAALFEEGTSVGADLKSFSYEGTIFQTVDSETGDLVTDFDLSTPSGDVSIAADEIPVLGSIAYP